MRAPFCLSLAGSAGNIAALVNLTETSMLINFPTRCSVGIVEKVGIARGKEKIIWCTKIRLYLPFFQPQCLAPQRILNTRSSVCEKKREAACSIGSSLRPLSSVGSLPRLLLMMQRPTIICAVLLFFHLPHLLVELFSYSWVSINRLIAPHTGSIKFQARR